MKLIPENNIQEIAEAFKEGKVIVFPTETSYGIGCDARDEQSIQKVMKVKNREGGKSLPLLVRNKEAAHKEIKFNQIGESLSDRYWPGPLSIVGDVQEGAESSDLCHFEEARCIRVSSSQFLQNLMEHINFPIVATSANISGEPAVYEAKEAVRIFKDKYRQPDIVVDGGKLEHGPASTIIRMNGEDIELIRQGPVEISL